MARFKANSLRRVILSLKIPPEVMEKALEALRIRNAQHRNSSSTVFMNKEDQGLMGILGEWGFWAILDQLFSGGAEFNWKQYHSKGPRPDFALFDVDGRRHTVDVKTVMRRDDNLRVGINIVGNNPRLKKTYDFYVLVYWSRKTDYLHYMGYCSLEMIAKDEYVRDGQAGTQYWSLPKKELIRAPMLPIWDKLGIVAFEHTT